MKKNFKGLLAVLSAAVIASSYAACGTNNTGNTENGNSTSEESNSSVTAVVLQAPMHPYFDGESYLLAWEPVENALYYLVDFNGEVYEVYGTESYLVPVTKDNTFKVMAVGDGVNYTNSPWSQEVYYELLPQVSVYDKVQAKLTETAEAEGLVLEKVIGISFVDLEANQYTDNIVFQTICSKNGESKSCELTFKHPNPISVAEMLQTFELATFNGKLTKNLVTGYDSAETMIGYNSVGMVEEFKNRGYNVSVVTSVVEEGNKVGTKFRFVIIGTFKAETDYDVQYFTAAYRVDILTPSANMSYNYEGLIPAKDTCEIKETDCVVHHEYETLEYMDGWAKVNDPNYSEK